MVSPGEKGRLQNLKPAQNISDGAKPRKPGIAGEIIAAGKARAGGRQEPRLDAHKGPGLEGRRPAQGEPDPTGGLGWRKPVGGINTEHEARAGAAKVHLLDKSIESGDRYPVDDWGGDPRGTESSPAKRAQSPEKK